MNKNQEMPSPQHYFETANAYQRTEILKAAIELDVFSAIGKEKRTSPEIAKSCSASERGMRILCDALVIIGFLTKDGNRYGLTDETAFFLTKQSPAYIGDSIEFLGNPKLREGFENLAAAVRKGGTVLPQGAESVANNPIWLQFARSMAPLTAYPSNRIAALVDPNPSSGLKVLDIAGGHGMFGIAFARHNPKSTIYPVDWPDVLEIAKDNAKRMEVSNRYHPIPGSAFEVEFGKDFDVVLLTNFLHHFDQATNEKLLKKVHAALKPAGRAVVFDFVPDEDRIHPAMVGLFSITMLAVTEHGDTYTFSQMERMFRSAGFTKSEILAIPPALQQVVISYA